MTALPQRLRAWLALAAFLGGLGLPFIGSRHLALDDDQACEPSFSVNRHTLIQVESATEGRAPDHCALCHWQRAVAGAGTSSRVVALFSAQPTVAPIAEATTPIGSDGLDRQPARAPPASTLS